MTFIATFFFLFGAWVALDRRDIHGDDAITVMVSVILSCLAAAYLVSHYLP